MAVDDHGIEAIRKSAEEVSTGDKSDYWIKTGIFDNQSGSVVAIAPSGTFEVGELIRLIGGNFESGALPGVTWDTNEVNGGTVTAVTGELVLATNTTANGAAEVQSVNRAEFTTATFNKAHLAFGLDDFAATDFIAEWGMFDPITPITPSTSGDGVLFRVEDGAVSLVRRKAGVDDEVVAEADFNGNTTESGEMFIKDENIHVYEMVYNAGRIDFYQDRRLLHRMISVDAVAYETVHLTLGARAENLNGNTTNNILRTRGFACSRIGTQSAVPDSITLSDPGTTLLKNSPGQLVSVIINETGAGGATLDLYDDVAAVGTPVVSLDLTNSQTGLEYIRRLNTGLFADVSGLGFEVVINWR